MTTGANPRAEVTLRPATALDGPDLLRWRNDPEAVRFSGTSRQVSADEHRHWLSARIRDPATRIWIAEERAIAVGQVRVDIEHGTGTVSLGLAPDARGRGLASAVLRALVTEIEGDPSISTLRAVAHADNVASLRAFEHAGFHLRGRGADGFLALDRPVGASR